MKVITLYNLQSLSSIFGAGIMIAVLGSIWKLVWSIFSIGYTSGGKLRHLLFVDGMIEMSLRFCGDANH